VVGFRAGLGNHSDFLAAQPVRAERFERRLAKVAAIECKEKNKMNKNLFLGLEAFGQSVWLDYLRRNALDNGEIQGLIEQMGSAD